MEKAKESFSRSRICARARVSFRRSVPLKSSSSVDIANLASWSPSQLAELGPKSGIDQTMLLEVESIMEAAHRRPRCELCIAPPLLATVVQVFAVPWSVDDCCSSTIQPAHPATILAVLETATGNAFHQSVSRLAPSGFPQLKWTPTLPFE